ncbi:MAG: hypothetical protein J6J74_07395 [Elusimicrobiaceae bacterium]|nr:hypothetical protein [Elusimicrobiaceae bacterium]
MLKQICDALTALRQYLLQTHWACRKSYAIHLLTDRIYQGISDDIDRLKELYIGATSDLSISCAETTFKDALSYIRALSASTDLDTHAMLDNCLKLEITVSNLLNQATDFYNNQPEGTPFKAGILNALGDIDEKRLRDIFLIQTELKK